MHGIELSSEMVARAELVSGFSCQQGDIRTTRIDNLFDAVISLFHVISYQSANSDILEVFRRANEHLVVGGLFIFDFWYSPAVYTQKPSVRVKRLEDDSCHITRIAEPEIDANHNTVDVNYTLITRNKKTDECQLINECHKMRHYSLPEIELIADISGFAVVKEEEFLTGNEPSEESWGVCAVLRKVSEI